MEKNNLFKRNQKAENTSEMFRFGFKEVFTDEFKKIIACNPDNWIDVHSSGEAKITEDILNHYVILEPYCSSNYPHILDTISDILFELVDKKCRLLLSPDCKCYLFVDTNIYTQEEFVEIVHNSIIKRDLLNRYTIVQHIQEEE